MSATQSAGPGSNRANDGRTRPPCWCVFHAKPADCAMCEDFPSLPNIECLIDGSGDITIGTPGGSIRCAARAADDEQTYALLVRRDDETLAQLLMRLDRAIEMAHQDEIFIDELNQGPDDRI